MPAVKMKPILQATVQYVSFFARKQKHSVKKGGRARRGGSQIQSVGWEIGLVEADVKKPDSERGAKSEDVNEE